MFWDLLGGYVGAFIYAFIVYNVILLTLNFVTRYKIFKKKAVIISLVLSVFLTCFLAELIYNWGNVLLFHLPMLVLVFLIDFRRIMYQKCPHCAERIKADAIKCKHCHTVLSIHDEEDSIKAGV
ncbi:hypothetical protein QNH20_18275 [Neobacillus sp. WH10]|uniref:hypothetical protein n=1 Tax=Neobacillus sp. WH10 TaxID=3047873 RepID=UPI0024C17290|nr:hypothetical protein [Neobacillus sp. WH10]WHY76059.1 hypothetical protein QNH20_18275 [Neobacillus sp. WH10]